MCRCYGSGPSHGIGPAVSAGYSAGSTASVSAMKPEVNVAARIAFGLALIAALLPVAIAIYGGILDLLPKSGPPSIGDGLGLVFGAIVGLQWSWYAAIPALIVAFASLTRPNRRLGMIAICIAVPVGAASIWINQQF